jgi:hypothetical protein
MPKQPGLGDKKLTVKEELGKYVPIHYDLLLAEA